MEKKTFGILSLPVIVAALGYFVDIYDLLLFGIIRKPSLESFIPKLSKEEVTLMGEMILKWQMWGLLIGGIIAGIIADKKGRLSVLFGSIILYSLANIANGFVSTVDQYKWVRFIAGIGLAGELGVGITLVSEIISKEKRGIATSMVAGIGLTGAVVAFIMKENFHWRTCYFIGGGLGLLLLFLRVSVLESSMFYHVKKIDIQRGNFFMLFNNADRFKRYLLGILIGLPTWFVIGVLVTFSSEFGEKFGIKEKIDPGKAIMFAYAAISIGDILIGFVSQWFKSRKKALFLFYGITILFMLLFFTTQWNGSASKMYWICAGLGFGTGFWAIFVTMGAEQFGTNLRATAATTIPNMVRGMLAIFILPLFQWLRNIDGVGYVNGGILAAIIIMIITIIAAVLTKETFNKDLNFLETNK
jgi:MFS transporter, putative metabolite:H+ symporter